ncbi:hypothetical protein [Capnocytophaga canis]|uniref:Uncharacterized protein n=1 Tax=Capnocytophaga canis TaxID=1848903 RepID=A0A0B7IPG1_9FLAO|nr:hypothetical protein [Capnocytophaga canis]CEN51922.1 hypothetical protein CCAND93_20041 [Capnocytophaga canis]
MNDKKNNKGLMFLYVLIIGALSWVLWTLFKKQKKTSDFSHVIHVDILDVKENAIGVDLDGNYYHFKGSSVFAFRWQKLDPVSDQSPNVLPLFKDLYSVGITPLITDGTYKGFKNLEEMKEFAKTLKKN